MNIAKEILKILIIEDDLVIAENLKEILLECGYVHVYVAKDYASAKQLKNTVQPYLFLVDVYLEGSEKDGIDIMLSEFMEYDKALIYISSLSDQETRERAKLTNPSAYLVKPFSAKQLEVAIDFAMTNHYLKSDKGREIIIDHCPFISEPNYFYVRVKDRYERVNKADVILLHSDGNYTDIVTKDKKIKHYLYLKLLLDRLSINSLVRCHNSYAVNIHHIHSFDNDNVYIIVDDTMTCIPLGNNYKGLLLDKIVKL